MLHTSVHQLRSPLSAVRTLSKLLLRRLDGEERDSVSRELAKDILMQAERFEDLLHPVSRLASELPAAAPTTPSAPRAAPPATLAPAAVDAAADAGDADVDGDAGAVWE